MDGIFRYARGIGSSLAIAAIAFGANYGQSWLFRSVEDVPKPAATILFDELATASVSLSPQRSAREVGKVRWQVAVVTNRLDAPSVDSSRFVSTQSTGVSQSLAEQTLDAMYTNANTTFGFTDVDVPVVRRRGQCDTQDTATCRVVVNDLKSSTEAGFYDHLRQLLAKSKSQDVFVFVHGFNVSLKQATARAAQMAEDMPFHGIMVAFSWQSQAQTDAYLTDEKLAERHFWSLSELLHDMKQNMSSGVRLHVLAHSMGNRVTLRALNALAGTIDPTGRQVDSIAVGRYLRSRRHNNAHRGPGHATPVGTQKYSVISLSPQQLQQRFPAWGAWHVEQTAAPLLSSLVLAAPDVDASEFSLMAGNIRHLCSRIVLYASDTDYALEASRKIHGGNYRAGDSRAQLNVRGMNMVRVSGIDSLDRLGHSYYGSNPTVLDQLAQLVRPPVDLSKPISELARQLSTSTQQVWK